MATKKTKTTPPAEATKPAENPDFVFKFTLEADQTITFQNGSKQDYSIQEILGVVMHFIFGQSKQVFDKVMTDHPELTDEQKEDEVYNIIVYNVITTQMLMFQTLNNLFGQFDQKKFEEKLLYAREKQEEFLMQQVDKAKEIGQSIQKKSKE